MLFAPCTTSLKKQKKSTYWKYASTKTNEDSPNGINLKSLSTINKITPVIINDAVQHIHDLFKQLFLFINSPSYLPMF